MKTKKNIDLNEVPLKQRHLVAISPGFFFARRSMSSISWSTASSSTVWFTWLSS